MSNISKTKRNIAHLSYLVTQNVSKKRKTAPFNQVLRWDFLLDVLLLGNYITNLDELIELLLVSKGTKRRINEHLINGFPSRIICIYVEDILRSCKLQSMLINPVSVVSDIGETHEKYYYWSVLRYLILALKVRKLPGCNNYISMPQEVIDGSWHALHSKHAMKDYRIIVGNMNKKTIIRYGPITELIWHKVGKQLLKSLWYNVKFLCCDITLSYFISKKVKLDGCNIYEMILSTVSIYLLDCVGEQYMQKITLITTPTGLAKNNINRIDLERCKNMNLNIINNDSKIIVICIVNTSSNINITVIGGGCVFIYLYDTHMCSLSFKKGTKSSVIVLNCDDVSIVENDNEINPPDITPPELKLGIHNSKISIKLPLEILLLFKSNNEKHKSNITCSRRYLPPNPTNIHSIPHNPNKYPTFNLLNNLTNNTVFDGTLDPPLLVSPDAVDDGNAVD